MKVKRSSETVGNILILLVLPKSTPVAGKMGLLPALVTQLWDLGARLMLLLIVKCFCIAFWPFVISAIY